MRRLSNEQGQYPLYRGPPPTLVISCEQGGVAADAASKISRLTAEMLEAEAAEFDVFLLT